MDYKFNEYQTPLTDELMNSLPQEVQDQLIDIINNIEFVRRLISPSREYAKDRPRDEKGRIIVDLANPHILENMDYFRPSALYFKKHGTFTHLKPNANKNSEYGKWIQEEVRRIWEGYVRESDGEWVTGYMYFYMNYSPIMLSRIREGSKQADRVEDFPETWEGIYWRFHYIDQMRNGGLYNDFKGGNHGAELARRGASKSYSLGSIAAHNFILGENGIACRKITTVITAYQKEYLIKDGTLNKFLSVVDFCAKNTQFPRLRLKSSLQEMFWSMGYKDVRTGIDMGTQNTVIGVSSKDDESKIRGKRAHILADEFGCHIKGTKILMYNGSVKNVEDIKVGDVIMGDDNTERTVLELYNGLDQLYKITLSNGDYQIVNSCHPVYFRTYDKNNGIYTEHTLTAPELMKVNNLNKNCYIPKAVLKFQYKSVAVNPYFLGLWLGNGDSAKLDVTTANKEVLNWLSDNYEGITENLNKSGTCKTFHLINKTHTYNKLFNDLDLFNNKHIPNDYKINSSEIQLQVIAGLIDSSGTYNDKKNFFKIIQRDNQKHILEDIKFMCESNGLMCSLFSKTDKKNKILYYILKISGNLSVLPTKTVRKNSTGYNSFKASGYQTGYTFKVEPYKEDEYYGFTVDKNHLFVLGDLTITHNTFPKLIDAYNVWLPSVQEGDIVFSMIYMCGCCCAGTKVLKEDGSSVNIEDVKVGDRLLGYDGNNSTVEDISWKQPIGYKECVRINTEKANYLECSTDHPILVLNKTKSGHSLGTCSFYRADELKVGDTLLMPRKMGTFGNINVPDAFLLGALFGNGDYSGNSCVTLSITSNEEYEYYNTHYDIGISKIRTCSNGKVYSQIYFRSLHSLLEKYGMNNQSFIHKKLPINIFEWDKESVCKFLGGYFTADGNIQTVKNKYRSIKLTCKYENTLIQIKQLLSKLGISAYIYKEHRPGKILKPVVNNAEYSVKGGESYVLYISNSLDIKIFREHIKLLIKEKQDRLDSYTIISSNRGIANNLRFVLRNNGKGRNLQGKKFDNLQTVTIKSIEPLGIQQIYNMTADTTHTYISNGFISSNTAGDSESDFAGAQEIMYNPKGYNMYALPNVYDKYNQGKPYFVFFFPGYINRKGCYNKDGVSDVIKALIEILMNRYRVKYNSTDPNTIIKTIAEIPITPSEAIVKTGVNIFPVADLTERVGQLDSNLSEYDDVYVGDLIFNKNGNLEFKPTLAQPIRDFPHKDNKIEGAIEIYQMPEIDKNTGRPYNDRYILGADPYDDDESNTMSLGSIFALDLWTDTIVAEYTGRPLFADDYYEICRKLCLFYNGRLNYEAHPYSQIVYTPNGVKLWGDISIGDKLFAPNGKEVTVVDIPVNEYMPIYKVKLADGRTIEASDKHIWNVFQLNHHTKNTINITTKEILKYGVKNKFGQHNFFIPNGGMVNYPYKEVPIDPYTLGLLLAEGAFTKFTKEVKHNKKRNYVQFSSSIENSEVYKNIIPYPIKYIGKKGYTWHLYKDGIADNLRELGLIGCDSYTKFIPELYLFNSYEVRMELLRGLMDGDGCANPRGASIFVTTSSRLKDDIMLLCRSLGINCSFSSKKPYTRVCKNGSKINAKLSYRINLYTDKILFKLPRKITKQHIYNPSSKGSKADSLINKTAIVSIEYSHNEMGKCVTVDSNDGLYLIGDFVVTHNCNKKGLFSHFSTRNSLYLLTDVLDFLKEKQMMKDGYGNKAHPYSEKVYTPDGVKKWGDIKVGDLLYNTYGGTTKVLNIPFDDVTDIYEITLKDGRKVRASENHLWKVIDWNNKEKILSTKELLNGYYRIKGKYKEYKYYIPKNEGVDFNKQDIELPPYFVGIMLGIGNILRKYGLINKDSHTKFIPDSYKYNSRRVRLAVLQGLLDTDGHVGYGGNPEYTTCSSYLCNDIMEVARSLGINCNMQKLCNSYREYYKVIFYTDVPLFRLQRKDSKQKITKNRAYKTGIINIKYIGKERAKCVTVDATDSCYLIGDFITTHNSKGTNASPGINAYARSRLRSWLLAPVPVIQVIDGEEKEVTIPRLFTVRNRALLKELITYNPNGNFDRISAMGMLMLLREDKMIRYQGYVGKDKYDRNSVSYLGNDPFFTNNYDNRMLY